MSDSASGLIDSVIRENELEDEVRHFRSSDKDAWYIDRHVLGVGSYGAAEMHQTACVAAVALAKKWLEDRTRLIAADLLISKPLVIIDDDWIKGDPDSAPPHVWICMAKNAAAFSPMDPTDRTVRMTTSGQPMVDAVLGEGLQLWRADSHDPELGGCWFLSTESEPS
jgi:hypothetical protein